MMPDASIDTWIFDLDNTLYPSECDLFTRIEERMIMFVAHRLGLGEAMARALRQDFLRRYGSTLRGLMTEHGVTPDEYLPFVHAVDMSVLRPNPRLGAALRALPGRRLVFTNAARGYAETVLQRLGFAGLFEAIHDIADQSYIPKPNPGSIADMVRRHGIDPRRAVMVEDMACNLVPAAALGMTTVWVRTPVPAAQPAATAPPPHHCIDDLAHWLAAWRRGESACAPGGADASLL